MYSLGSTLMMLLSAKILKPKSQKNLLTLGQSFIGIILINLIGARGAERAYQIQQN